MILNKLKSLMVGCKKTVKQKSTGVRYVLIATKVDILSLFPSFSTSREDVVVVVDVKSTVYLRLIPHSVTHE